MPLVINLCHSDFQPCILRVIKLKLQYKTKERKNNMNKSASHLYVISIIFFIAFAVMCYKGYDKMTNYDNSDYSYENAYVGGDAYNYIINGTHATAFFVLAIGFLISGILCVIGGYIANRLSLSLTGDDHYKLNMINASQQESLTAQKIF